MGFDTLRLLLKTLFNGGGSCLNNEKYTEEIGGKYKFPDFFFVYAGFSG